MIRLLVNRGAKVNAKANDGTTALHMACGNGHLEIGKLLIENGANVHAEDYENRWTPFDWACENGHSEVARLLMDNGIDINKTEEYLKQLLFRACENGHLEVLKLLLSRGTNNVNMMTEGSKMLHAACKENQVDVVMFLVRQYPSLLTDLSE